MTKSIYLPTWERLKRINSAEVVARTELHRRIIKAVRKRKDLDVAFKYECEEQNVRAVLLAETYGTVIRFTLQKHLKVNGLLET